jgi:hypothetical protein
MEIQRLLHRNEGGIQINMENTPSYETAYKLAHRACKATFSSAYYSTFLGFVKSQAFRTKAQFV